MDCEDSLLIGGAGMKRGSLGGLMGHAELVRSENVTRERRFYEEKGLHYGRLRIEKRYFNE